MNFTVPDDIGWEVDETNPGESSVYLAVLPSGPISVLQGTAALIWLAATEGPKETLADRVAEEAGVEVSEVGDDVQAFVQELLNAGLLAP